MTISDINHPTDGLMEKGRELFRLYSDIRNVTDKPEYKLLRDYRINDEIEDICVMLLIEIFMEGSIENNNIPCSSVSEVKKFLVNFRKK